MSRRSERTIEGFFDAYRQPRVRITVADTHKEIVVNAAIDTGFDGDLCLPTQIAIGLAWNSEM